MELKIKTFVQDCKRPNWLLALLVEEVGNKMVEFTIE